MAFLDWGGRGGEESRVGRKLGLFPDNSTLLFLNPNGPVNFQQSYIQFKIEFFFLLYTL